MPEKTVALNRRARYDYAVEQTLEAGIVLTGTEIKSIRAGRVNLGDAYARIEHGEAILVGAHIAAYEQGNRYNHEPLRTRKLRLYLRNGLAKLELGVARGKKTHDKRRTIAERDVRRELQRETKAKIKM
jgi:SsrA-binding protein